jgi:hypothetical protein
MPGKLHVIPAQAGIQRQTSNRAPYLLLTIEQCTVAAGLSVTIEAVISRLDSRLRGNDVLFYSLCALWRWVNASPCGLAALREPVWD